MRRKIVAGNWKMNTNVAEAVSLAQEIVTSLGDNTDTDIVICPPYISLASVAPVIKGSAVKLGAQDVHYEENGAYTGKVSVSMLKDLGVEFVIIGHSEQRTYFHETNGSVNKKVKKVLEAGLVPIICVGETLEERETDKTQAVVEDHVRGAYAGITEKQAENTVVAYEPVWAIGTGKTATSEQAQEVHQFIRTLLKELFGETTAESIRIQYGGSMKPENAGELKSKPDVDGGLIGGAALKSESFKGIISA